MKTACLLFAAVAAFSARAQEIVLQDDTVLAAFDAHSGALVRLESKPAHWTIERRPELGASFRLHAPLPNDRYNFALGEKQRPASVQAVGDHEVRIRWDRMVTERGGTVPIAFEARITLERGALTFAGTLENRSALTVETLDWPRLADLTPPAPGVALAARTMWYGNLDSVPLYPTFKNEKGYWGDFFPTKTFDSNRSLFCLIQGPRQGLYVELADPTQRYLLEYTFEQHPGPVDSVDNRVPEGPAIGSLPVHTEFRTCHFLFAHPQSTVELAPIVVRPYQGDWHAGVDYYRAWRATWFKSPRIPAWVRDVHSWQQLMINSPEEDWRVPFRDLPAYGEECARNGVGAIQLVGWNRGGQDRGDPLQDPDPGLGTAEQLRQAIAAVQARGVKIVLFGKLNWADMTTDWYRREGWKYQCTDPYGQPYQQGGYSYFTPTQLAGINNRRRAVMDFNDPAYQAVAAREFQKVVALGAAGWLFDENCHHGPVKYSFAPDHGYAAPGYIYGGDLPLAHALRRVSDRKDPEFLFAGEGHMDWLKQEYPCSYFRIEENSTPVDRYIDSQAPLVVAVTGFDDREKLNLLLLDRYIISYEPFNFKGHLEEFPLTLAYGKRIDALRRRYRDWLWDGEFRDTLGARVDASGRCRYSVFVTKAGKRAVVVINQERDRAIDATVDLPQAGALVSASPEAPEAVPAGKTLQVAPRSAVVLMER